jgi:undecaprenyl-phosphate 4-deoxy-4-formamido-L-arabinose transferase
MDVSVIIPVYNEEENLRPLFARLCSAMDTLGKSWEVIFTNDGSVDSSGAILREFCKERDNVRLIDFNGNFGQHTAIIAGFEKASGDVIITLDADLQNPPEEIGKLLQKIDEGYDTVGGYRKVREDTAMRRYCSKFVNFARDKMTNIRMKDQGCMLRAYKRNIVQAILQTNERSLFIPALAYTYSERPTDVEVEHSARAAGESKYNMYKLIRLNFDLITGFTLVPLQMFTLFGFLASFGSFALVVILLFRRFFLGAEAEGVFTLFAMLFFLISVAIVGIGLIGEYIGRIYKVVQSRPKYVIKEIVGFNDNAK